MRSYTTRPVRWPSSPRAAEGADRRDEPYGSPGRAERPRHQALMADAGAGRSAEAGVPTGHPRSEHDGFASDRTTSTLVAAVLGMVRGSAARPAGRWRARDPRRGE